MSVGRCQFNKLSSIYTFVIVLGSVSTQSSPKRFSIMQNYWNWPNYKAGFRPVTSQQANWVIQEELEFWKSKAVGLKSENDRMLRDNYWRYYGGNFGPSGYHWPRNNYAELNRGAVTAEPDYLWPDENNGRRRQAGRRQETASTDSEETRRWKSQYIFNDNEDEEEVVDLSWMMFHYKTLLHREKLRQGKEWAEV